MFVEHMNTSCLPKLSPVGTPPFHSQHVVGGVPRQYLLIINPILLDLEC